MKKTPNPVIKLLFQVCFSPHERAALAILLIKTHITMSRLSPRPRSPELGSAGSPGHKTGGKRQMGTVTLYSTPGIPDSGYTHCHSPITSPQQEKWHRSHKVMLDRYHCSAQCKPCADGDALCRAPRLDTCAHNVPTEHSTNHILVICSVWNSHLHLLQL